MRLFPYTLIRFVDFFWHDYSGYAIQKRLSVKIKVTIVTIVTFLDYWLQIYGVKKAGGGKYAIRGSIIGILLGIFLFPPFGILVGAFIGAFIGAKMETDSNEIKIAFGAVLGFIAGTILKVCTSVYITYIILF